MHKFLITMTAALMVGVSSFVGAAEWVKIDDVAQYGEADWTNIVSMVKGVTAEEAQAIADNNPEITYFFIVKGWQMVLHKPNPQGLLQRIFRQGDVVFFKGEPWWGSAPGLADGYIKSN